MPLSSCDRSLQVRVTLAIVQEEPSIRPHSRNPHLPPATPPAARRKGAWSGSAGWGGGGAAGPWGDGAALGGGPSQDAKLPRSQAKPRASACPGGCLLVGAWVP